MNYFEYKFKNDFPKNLFCFIASYIICSYLFADGLIANYLLIPLNSFSSAYFLSAEMFLMYIRLIGIFLVQSSIFSILSCITDLVFLESDYEKLEMLTAGEKPTIETYTKIQILKHIPIFSLINAMKYLFFGKTIIDSKFDISYTFSNEISNKEHVTIQIGRLVIFLSVMQMIGSGFMYMVDKEIDMDKNLTKMEYIKDVETNALIDSKNDANIFNLIIHLEDGYIHYNKLTYTIDTVKETLSQNKQFIKNKYLKSIGDITGFNIIIYNDYTKTWDKYMYDSDMEESYEIESISSNINDIDIYITDGVLVYNFLTNLSKQELAWDMAEFIHAEFEDDILNLPTQEKIKKITNQNQEINKYVINILSKEYYTSKESSYFVYTKNTDDKSWHYYDNEFYTLEKQENLFKYELEDAFADIQVNFKKLYTDGVIVVKSNIATNDELIKILNNTDAGKNLILQVKNVGKVPTITFEVEEAVK